MLKKLNLRALKPGQWARLHIPDLEVWRKGEGLCKMRPGDEVEVCVMPRYRPTPDTKSHFEWDYQVAYRTPGSTWPRFQVDDAPWVNPYEFGMINAAIGSVNWDKETSDAYYQGKGIWLYEPASDDPGLCPGGDWSRFECDICGKHVVPFSNDQGDLICGTCETTGLVIFNDEVLERLEKVREFARSVGLSSQLEHQLAWLAGYGSSDGQPRPGRQCVLHSDFAPHSFTFAHFRLPTAEETERRFIFNGGLIYQGPSCPADGSFPSLCVSLASGNGWFCHT
jgi:hypothetical protein